MGIGKRGRTPMKVALIYSNSRDPAVSKVAEALAGSGHHVKLLVWNREGTSNLKYDTEYETYRFRFKAPYDKLTVLFYLPVWWAYVLFFLLKSRLDVVHACNLDSLVPTIVTKLIKGAKLYYTIYDFYADNLPAISPLIPNGVRKLISALEKHLIRFVDTLFLVDECRYEQVKGARIKKLMYVYNSPPDYLGAEDYQVPMKSMPQNTTTLFYAGVISETRGLKYMMEAIRDIDDVKLTIAGACDNEGILSMIAKSGKVEYIGTISYESVIQMELHSDILFALYDPKVPNNKYASPNKLFEAMMCGKPIIVNIETAASRIVRRENCGLTVPYGNVGSIIKAVMRLKDDAYYRHILGNNGRKAYETRYSWEIMKGRLINAYEELAKSV